MKQKVVFIILIIIIVSLCGFFGFTKGKQKEEVKSVSSYTIKAMDFENIVSTKGKIEAKDLRKLYVATLQKVMKLNKKIGDKVEKGEIILTFDGDYRTKLVREIEMLKLEISNAKLSLENMNISTNELNTLENENNVASMEFKKEKISSGIALSQEELDNSKEKLESSIKDLKQKEELLNSGGISQNEYKKYVDAKKTSEEEYNRKRIAYNNLKKDLSLSEREIDLANKNLSYTKEKMGENKKTKSNQVQQEINVVKKLELELLTKLDELNKLQDQLMSPVTGTILDMVAEENYKVDPEKPVAEVADISQQKLKVELPTDELKGVAVGQKVIVNSDLLDKPLKATVTKIIALAKEIQKNGVTDNVVEVEMILDEVSNMLRPGYEVKVDIIKAKKKNAFVIPAIAVLRENNKAYVYVINKENKLEKKEIKVGMENIVEVEVSGLKGGEKIVTNLSPEIKAGDIVKIEG